MHVFDVFFSQICFNKKRTNYNHCNIFNDKLNVRRTWKKSEPQMGIEPTTLRDLVGCSIANH